MKEPKKYRLKDRPVMSYTTPTAYEKKPRLKMTAWEGLNLDMMEIFEYIQSLEQTLTDLLRSNQVHPAVRSFLNEIMEPDWM